jgi:poly-gamma-glutamate capsule biosynthesis protein CapA/YwtB (metallophosphatase superfamily)
MAGRLIRRDFVKLAGGAACGAAVPKVQEDAMTKTADARGDGRAADQITLFLAGDVMLGRGIDQILPHPSDPALKEDYVRSATTYVGLAERAHGPIPRPVDLAYVWGDALEVLDRDRPDVRIVNLETSITTSNDFAPKGINYRMHPGNIGCLSAARIDCCTLANNHVLDFGRQGLLDTLQALEEAGIASAGAGRDAAAAAAPAIVEAAGGGRVLVFSFGEATSGIPPGWAAGTDEPGVSLLEGLSDRTIARIAERTRAVKRPGDIAIASIHWGGNWGYDIPPAQRRFAHQLIDRAGFDVVHGHSSHHPKAIEIHEDRPILYGCGDFLNDYEGIEGHEAFRDDLVLMYLPSLSASSGALIGLRLVPFQIRNFRLNRASRDDAAWLRDVLGRESGRFGTSTTMNDDGAFAVTW